MAAHALRVVGATKAFERGSDRHVVFEDVELEVAEGEVLALLGPSGCGKSTLLRSIAGLESLDHGRIEVGQGLDPEHAVGIAFQQPSLLPWLDVRDNVGLGLRFAANRAADRPGLVDDTLADLGLAGLAESYPDELSGGQAQRANVARLVVTGRPILLLDEPFAALDPATRSSLQDWLVELQQSRSLTVIVVTHDVNEALRLGDRVALMSGSPGAIGQVWTVADHADSTAVARLHDEILDLYDVDQSPERAQPAAWPVPSDTIELEGATP